MEINQDILQPKAQTQKVRETGCRLHQACSFVKRYVCLGTYTVVFPSDGHAKLSPLQHSVS